MGVKERGCVDIWPMSADRDFQRRLADARNGRHHAVAYLWRNHHPALFGWLRSFDPLVAEDVASETWIEALRGLASFTGDEKQFRSWLFTIGRRRLIDVQRREYRRPEKERSTAAQTMTSPDVAIEALDAIESELAVAQIVANLPREQAEVVLLRVIGGLDVSQVAEVIGKKPGAVRVLQHRGLRRLAEVLNSPHPNSSQSHAREV
jgi:RNA polymerase sigma-70 factor (ECF subfamily)